MENLKGKHILVTGASSGIGLAIVKTLDKYGANAVMVARREEKMREEAKKLQGSHEIFSYDFTDYQNVEEIFKFCREKNILLDGMVHCAGFSSVSPIRMIETEVMVNLMAVNYFSFVELIKYYIKRKYSNTGGAIIGISSYATVVCEKGMVSYAASKAAMEITAKIASKELVKRKTRVNGILSSWVDTPMTSGRHDKYEDFVSNYEMQEDMIKPESLAEFACFLLSDHGKYMNGSMYEITHTYGK